jgi:ATP phosphoribosyltransferase
VTIRVALPKGRLLAETASLLEKAGWQLTGYDTALRNYRIKSSQFPDLQIKVLHEKDIPIQIAIGNYDIGICGLDWIGTVREIRRQPSGKHQRPRLRQGVPVYYRQPRAETDL